MTFDSLAGGWAKALSIDKKQFNMFFEKMMDGFAYHKIILDKAGKPVDYVFLEVNNAFEKLTGLQREKIIGRKVTEVLKGIERDPADWIRRYGKVALTGEPTHFENYAEPLDKWFKVSAYCPEKGYFVALFEDITERKRAEEALRDGEQRWSTTLSSIGDAVIASDLSGNVSFLNPVAEALTGWKLEEAYGKPVRSIFNIVNEQTGYEVESPVNRVLKEGVVVGLGNHTVLIRKDGLEVPIDDSGAPIKGKDGNIAGVVLVFRDISERKKAEEEIQNLNERFEMAQRAAGVGVWDWDVKIGSIKWTAEMFRLFGLDPKTTVASLETWNSVLHPEDKVRAGAKIEEALRNHSFLDNEYRIVKPNGQTVWINALGQGEYDSLQKPIRMTGICMDITERKKIEDALKALNDELEERVRQRTAQVSTERQRLYNVLETLPSYVILLDRDYRVAFANKVFRETFGEDHGRRCYEYLFGKDHECENCETYKVYKENKPQHWYWTGPNGHDYDIYDFPFKEADGSTLILEMGIDITERKKAEAQALDSAKKLKDAERLAAIGATAGMVGHDIRNPLQAIASDVYLAKSSLSSMPEGEAKEGLKESLDGIDKNVDYINKIVQDLQDFARPLNPKIEESDLKQILKAMISKNGIPKNVKVKIDVDESAHKIRADAYYLKRILSNLITNSVQAMPKGGKLTIKARKEAGDSILSVHDTGVGIPKNIQDKMFNVMFTTKSKGQGFGLPVVKRMTESLGGNVSFKSKEGKGTTFTIRFPPPRAKR